jgi:hypothetical protein
MRRRDRHAARVAVALVAVALMAVMPTAPGCARSQANTVAAFLEQAERQTEAPQQRAEVRQALSDMLQLTPDQLAQRRYRDYADTPGAWTALQLLERYFVPAHPAVLDSATFYRDVTQPAARQAIQRQLTAVEQALAGEP